MEITTEIAGLFLTAVGVMGVTASYVGSKLSKVTDAINSVKEMLLTKYVSHDICQERMEHCPCGQAIDNIREDVNELKERTEKITMRKED